MGESEKPYHSTLRFELVEDALPRNNPTKPVLSYGEIVKYNKMQTKFLPAEDPPKKIRLGKVSRKTIYRLEMIDKDKEF
ncbi:MAG: hypothetical protein KAW40_04040 [Candidatus Aenigmarchaeota archaeon]|nr:hypothetical protein [Candidatus Aenigmarchaeota archaeon]